MPDEVLAQARRLHMHVMSGGNVTAMDMSRLVQGMERMQAERDRLRSALGEMVTTFYDAGCHICGGDCASANPPVGGCPVGVIRRARAALGDDRA